MKAASIGHALRRGTVHAIVGLAAATALFFLPRLVVLAALTAVTATFLFLEATRLRVPFLKQCFTVWLAPFLRPEEESKFTGCSYLLVGCLVTGLAFPRDIASLAIAFLSLGDPVATVVGVWKGDTRLWGKSVEGNIACLVVCLLIAILVANILENPPPLVAIAGAIFAAVFQALPLRLNDNLTIPLGSALAMMVMSVLG